MNDYLERVLAIVGKTREEFDREVEALRGTALINQDVSSLAEATSFLIVNAEMTAQANAQLISMVFELTQRITELEGKTNA